MVQVDHHEGGIAGGVRESEHAAARGSCQFRPGTVVAQFHGVVTRTGRFRAVAEAGPVARIRVLVGPGGRFGSPGPGDEQEVAEVRDARAAQVREAEAHDRGFRVLVARCDVVVVIIRVRTDLDAPERHLCSGIHVSEAGRSDERIDIPHQILCRCLDCQAGRHRGQEKGLFVHKTNILKRI